MTDRKDAAPNALESLHKTLDELPIRTDVDIDGRDVSALPVDEADNEGNFFLVDTWTGDMPEGAYTPERAQLLAEKIGISAEEAADGLRKVSEAMATSVATLAKAFTPFVENLTTTFADFERNLQSFSRVVEEWRRQGLIDDTNRVSEALSRQRLRFGLPQWDAALTEAYERAIRAESVGIIDDDDEDLWCSPSEATRYVRDHLLVEDEDRGDDYAEIVEWPEGEVASRGSML